MPNRASLNAIAAHDPAALRRRYVISGAFWGVFSAAVFVLALAPSSLGISVPAAFLATGRLASAYVFVLVWGALSLPLAGAVLGQLWTEDSDSRALMWSGLALWAWNAAVAVGAVSVLVGLQTPGAWGGAPWWSHTLLLLGGGLWLGAVWLRARNVDSLSASGWLAVLAGVLLLSSQSIGLVASIALDGVPRALADAMHGRLAVGGWLPLAGFAVVAAVLPKAVGRPLFGRRSMWWGTWSWFILVLASAAVPLHADMLPPWLSRPMDAVSVLAIVPAALVAVGLFGTLVGEPRCIPGATAPRFLLVASAGVLAGQVARSAGVVWQTGPMQFTEAFSSPGLLPPMAGLLLMAVGASYASLADGQRGWLIRPRYHMYVAFAAAVAVVAPIWPQSLAESVVGPTNEMLSAGFLSRFPGALLWLVVAVVWLANVTVERSTETDADGAANRAQDSVGGTNAVAVAGIAAVVLAALLFVTLFLPLVDPAMSTPTQAASVHALIPGSLADIGRDVYVADGCDACHTQRVRPVPSDGDLGPALSPGDHVYGPALIGFRRAGPDLAWIGDRHTDRALMAEALTAHGPTGTVSMPWLMSSDGATPTGLAVVEYLIQLRSQPGGAP